MNKLNIKYQWYPKLTKTGSFEKKKYAHVPTHNPYELKWHIDIKTKKK